MTTMNISLPDDMKAWIDAQVTARGFMTSSEFIRDLVRREKDIAALRQRLLEAEPTPIAAFDETYFEMQRARISKSI